MCNNPPLLPLAFKAQIWYSVVPNSILKLSLRYKYLLEEPFQVKEGIFKDFKSKAGLLVDTSPSEWPSIRLQFGIRKWAEAAHAAFQTAFCYMHGFGTERDIPDGARYLAVSAEGGFVNAYSFAFRFHKLHPEFELPNWTRRLDGLFEFVSTGPPMGLASYLENLQLLRTLDPQLAQKAVDKVNAFAFSEIGEEHLDDRPHEEETYQGPDIRYQWFEQGSMGLLQKLMPLSTADELIRGFKSGLFPERGSNYNNETAMYMCCRLGAADAVVALSEAFEWFRKQSTIPTLDGRFPLHHMYAFPPESVARVGGILRRNGADVYAVDAAGFRAVDYAIIAGRDDVVGFLLDQRRSSHCRKPGGGIVLI